MISISISIVAKIINIIITGRLVIVLNSIKKNSTCGVSLGHWCYFFLVIIIKITLTFNCSPVVFSGSSTIFCLGHNHHNHFHFLIALLQIQSKSVNLIFSRWELCKDTVVIIHILVMDQTLGNVMVPMKGRYNEEQGKKCNQCDFISSWTSSLRKHLKTHTGEKSNKCNQCDFASSGKGNLSKHLKTHSGEKAHSCNQCDY